MSVSIGVLVVCILYFFIAGMVTGVVIKSVKDSHEP